MNTSLSYTDRFFLLLIAIVSILRIVLLVVFYLLFTYTGYLDRIIEDSFHHYLVGVVFLALSLIIPAGRRRLVAQTIGISLIVEEHAVILEELGIHIPGYFYLNGIDLLVSLSSIGVVYSVVKLAQRLKIWR